MSQEFSLVPGELLREPVSVRDVQEFIVVKHFSSRKYQYEFEAILVMKDGRWIRSEKIKDQASVDNLEKATRLFRAHGFMERQDRYGYIDAFVYGTTAFDIRYYRR